MSARDLTAVQERLGVTFADEALLDRALTHPSWAQENGGTDYERLEFLGDSVLGFIIAGHLHEAFPDLPEGPLTRMKTALVSGNVLADAGRELGLDSALRLGKGAARESVRDSVVEASFEAVVGALYLDAGLDVTRAFALRALGDRMDPETLLAVTADPKTALQELSQSRGLGLPAYRIVAEDGPPHERVFTSEVSFDGEVRGSGQGVSKQAAERAAAASALEALGR